jgi:hypothetical protein
MNRWIKFCIVAAVVYAAVGDVSAAIYFTGMATLFGMLEAAA